jgi:hypothetical protein
MSIRCIHNYIIIKRIGFHSDEYSNPPDTASPSMCRSNSWPWEGYNGVDEGIIGG